MGSQKLENPKMTKKHWHRGNKEYKRCLQSLLANTVIKVLATTGETKLYKIKSLLL